MLCAGLFTKAQASVENFLWAMGTVNARNWGIDSPSGVGKINVMAPVADLFNHRCDFGVGGWGFGGTCVFSSEVILEALFVCADLNFYALISPLGNLTGAGLGCTPGMVVKTVWEPTVEMRGRGAVEDEARNLRCTWLNSASCLDTTM